MDKEFTSAPSNFLNCNVLDSMKGILGAVIQCKINHVMEQGTSQRLISAAFSAVKDLKLVIAVDEDVDIFDPTDVMWAITVRTKPDEDAPFFHRPPLSIAIYFAF